MQNIVSSEPSLYVVVVYRNWIWLFQSRVLCNDRPASKIILKSISDHFRWRAMTMVKFTSTMALLGVLATQNCWCLNAEGW